MKVATGQPIASVLAAKPEEGERAMKMNSTAGLQQLIDREAIRELVLCYSRAIDRKDMALLRDLYTGDATDQHGPTFTGDAEAFYAMIENSLPQLPYTGHHVCNHMVNVEGDEGNGEVYALAWHYIPDPGNSGQMLNDIQIVRYIDNYRRCADAKWRFSRRLVTFELHTAQPFTGDGLLVSGPDDPSYEVCKHALFQRGPRP